MSNRGRPTKTKGAKQVLPPIRITEDQQARYRQAAKVEDKCLSAWIKSLADKEADRILGNK
jgi:hypothetical protein